MLPKIAYPTFTVTVPSTKKTVSLRPYLVAEEKILLTAKETKKESDMIEAIRSVLEACGANTTGWALFDLEYAFLKLTARSVDNMVTISFKDQEDGKVRDFPIDLDEIEVEFNPEENELSKVKLDGDLGLKLHYPPPETAIEIEKAKSMGDAAILGIVACIDSIWEGEKVYKAKDHTSEELITFVQGLRGKDVKEISRYLKALPRMRKVIEWENDMGTKRSVELTKLADFFPLG